LLERKSYSGFIVKLGNNVLNWESRNQKCVALSSTEAEYLSIGDDCKDLCFIKNLICELINKDIKIVIYNDNQSAHKLLECKEYCHKRSKHIDIRFHFVKYMIKDNFAQVKYLPTENMIADVLTKPLGKIKHENFTKLMNVKV
jgi:hypothetical protein